jgi:hypothetical protein
MEDGNSQSAAAPHLDDRVKLNVGGKLFETTLSTVRSGGPDSLLAVLADRPTYDLNPVFIDRDPEIFSVLLSLLRSNRLPSTACRFSKQELADEALYYGIESRLVTGGFLQDKWAISYTRGSTISFIRGSYWWYREVLLRSWAVLGDFKRFLDNVVLVASLSFAFYACFMRFSISRCRPLYKASLENVEVAC